MKLLIIDDDDSIRATLKKYLSSKNYTVTDAESGQAALLSARNESPDVVLCDIGLKDMNGIDVMKRLREDDPTLPVLIITGQDDMETTIKAVQAGAYDYLVKPIDIDRLELAVRRACESKTMSDRLSLIAAENTSAVDDTVATLVGKSRAMQEIYKFIGQTAMSKVTVCIEGESGTGKERIARAIHFNSPDKDEPFVAVNCSAIPETLMESELFGYMRGSFTGAMRDKKGKFEQAGHGTIFLDEIGEIAPAVQVKLLRVLQERMTERIGGERLVPMNARIIAATNKNLEEMVKAGTFRDDLYYRLNVAKFMIPPLRERSEDIPVLVHHLLRKINTELHKTVRKVPDDVMNILMVQEWRGNIRELENVLTRAVVLSKGDILLRENLSLAEPDRKTPTTLTPDLRPLRDVERDHILHVLEACGGEKTKTVAILGISKPTLYAKLKEYGVLRDDG
jgi:two-component system response regulator AtoC